MKRREYSERLTIAAQQNIKEKDFWMKQLSGEPVKTAFPYDSKYQNKPSTINSVDFRLNGEKNKELLSQLTTLTKDSEYTLNLVLITCINLLLNKYTGSSDILVGMPIYKQDIQGDFINTVLVLRNPIQNNMTFKELILQVKQTITDAVENQNYPIEILAEKLAGDYYDTGFPLFDVAVLLENIHEKNYLQHIDCNMTFLFKKQDGYINGIIEYNKWLYEKKTIENIITHFVYLLQKALADVNLSLAALGIVTEEEKKEQLYDFNNTEHRYPREKFIHQLFRDQVEKTPTSIAAAGLQSSYQSLTLSYRQLFEKVMQLAGELKARGVVPGKIVGLMLERSLDIPAGILGILETGTAYMPLDPEFPEGRIEYMLKDSNSSALVTTRELFEKIPRIKNWEAKTIFLENLKDKQALPSTLTSTSASGLAASADNAVYIIYTSGTTGRPKGVILTHQNLVNYITWFTRTINLTAKDKTILTSSFAFDLGYTSLYPPLLRGGELHILPREVYLLGEQLLDYIKEKGITYLKVTPSLFSVIVASPNFSAGVSPPLRLVLVGGEAINVMDIEKAHEICLHLQVINHYGPTEATIGCVTTFIDFQRFDAYKEQPVIGKPIYNTSVYILGKDLDLLPIGVPGELCVSGDCLANGYLNRLELTAEKFIATDDHGRPRTNFNQKFFGGPGGGFSKKPPGRRRLYKTGDLARWLPDGTIEFLGRIDTQVKVMGYRIELAEIQDRLLKHKEIENAHIMVRDASETSSNNGSGDKYLCAYIVPKPGIIKSTENTPGNEKILKLKELQKQLNLPAPPPVQEQSVVGFFQEKVKNNPDQIAVKSNGQSLTYASLDKYARRLAKKIREEYDDRYKLSKRERTRYMRQMLLHGWGIESQEKLKSTTVFVAGAGGGASPTIMQLALAGFGTIIVCDYDQVELSNLNRQFLHDESRLDMNKALSAQMTAQRVNPHVNVIPRTEKLTKENVAELVGDAAVIFDMFDGLEAKFILSEYAVSRRIPHIIAAMTDINGYSAILHPPHTPCYHCIFDRKKWETIVAGMGNYLEEYEKNPLPVAATALFMSTAFGVNEAIKYVLGFGTPAYNRFVFFNQRGSEELADTPSFQATTHAFSEHFRNNCKEQGFDWEIGWRGNFLEELTINPDPYCPFCGIKSKTTPTTTININNQEQTKPKDKKETIALLLSRDIYMAVGIIAALKSAKTYVPLDPDLSMKRLISIMEDSESRIILTDSSHLDLAEKLRNKVNKNIKIIDINIFTEPGEPGVNDSRENLEIEVASEQTAYMLYPPQPPQNPEEESVTESHQDILDFARLYTYNLDNNAHLQEKIDSISSGSFSFKAAMMDFYGALLSAAEPYQFEKSQKPMEPADFSQELREYLLQELPDYMIPSHFVLLDKIPQTPNGKVDRKALPQPRSQETGEDNIAPRNEIELKLVIIWSQVLEIEKDRLSINSNFFELGGNSLKATVLTSKIHKELDAKVPLGEVFKSPQIKNLSAFIESLEKDKFIAIEIAPVKPYYSLSSSQKRLYILHMMDEKNTSYNMYRAFMMRGQVDKNRVEEIFKQLIQRHESFRTSFEMKESEPVQIIHEKVDFAIEYFDLTAQGEQRNEKNIVEDFLRCFDLTRPPLLRVGVVKLAEEQYVLVLDLHHIISDGTSMRKLEREFQLLYAGDTLPPLKLQYKDFSEWQNRLFETEAIKKQKEYWLNRFKGKIPALTMPHDFPRPAEFTAEGDAIRFEIDPQTTADIKQLVTETQTTSFMVLMAAFNVLLLKYSGQEDIVVGTPIIGRRHADLENIIGLFVNMLALRNQPKREKTFADFLQEVKTNAFDANENQDYQFEQLVWDLNLKAEYGRYPLFEAVFVLDVDESRPVKVSNQEELNKLKVSPYQVKMEKLQHEFLLNASEYPNIISLELQYSTQLYKETTVRKMTEHYIEILRQIIANREIKLADITISHDFIAAKPISDEDNQGDFRL